MQLCSKRVEIQLLNETSAETTAWAAIDNFFTKFGYLLQIDTDEGKTFDRNLFWKMCKLLWITKTCTKLYWPYSNGQVEWYNWLLLQLIQFYIHIRPGSWDQDLQLCDVKSSHDDSFESLQAMLEEENVQVLDLMDSQEKSYVKIILLLSHKHLQCVICIWWCQHFD